MTIMENPLISIIVPVYNVEDYIKECLDSIEKQEYKNFEASIVIDGSTDSSIITCKNYAKRNNNFIVFEKKNGGLSDARNFGLDKANGKFVMFLDSDDYIPTYCLLRFVEAIKKTNADIICGGFKRFTNEGKILFTRVPEKEEKLTASNAMKEMISEGKINTMACTKVFRKDIFDRIKFPVGKYHEDIYVMHRIFASIKSVALIDEVIYFYRVNPMSISEGKFQLKRQDAVYAEKDRYDFVCKNYPELEQIQMQFYIWNCVNNNFMLIKEGIPKKFIEIFKDNNKRIKPFKINFLKSNTSFKAKSAMVLCLIIDIFLKDK